MWSLDNLINVHTRHNHIWDNAEFAQITKRVLCRLGLEFLGSREPRHIANMNIEAVLAANLSAELTNCLNKMLAFHITDRTTNLNNVDV